MERLTPRNAAGHTPLLLAAKLGHLRHLPRAVLTATALTLKNDAGYTPLHHAARSGHPVPIPLAARPTALGPLRRFFRNLGRSPAPF